MRPLLLSLSLVCACQGAIGGESAEPAAVASDAPGVGAHGLEDRADLAWSCGRSPGTVIPHGVEPERLELSMELSPLLRTVLPSLVARVVEEVSALAAA